MLVSGIDEAGRGSMLGPLVVAGVRMEEGRLETLYEMGIRDSKRHTPAVRKRLCAKIMEVADGHHIAYIRPRSIDASVRHHGLNMLEARYMAKVAAKLKSDRTYVDSCDVNPERFGRNVSRLSGGIQVTSSHHADSRFVIVSAASILAKVMRDKAVGRLRRHHEAVGSGYPSDQKSVAFLDEYYKRNGSMPSFARMSWKPVKRMTLGSLLDYIPTDSRPCKQQS